MRHGKKFNHLGRKAGHRKALMRNLSIALIEHKRITTTLAKAKALRKYLEPIITKSKTNTVHSRRVVFSYLNNKDAVKELFGPIAAKIAERPGGYLRIFKIGFRQGDGAEMAIIEFVDFNDTLSEDTSKKRTRRSRRRGKTNNEAANTVNEVVENVEEEVEEATDGGDDDENKED